MAEIVRMPALSDTMEEGTLVAWHKKVGDTVEAGEILAEIETDKAVMEFESFFDGVILYIGVEEGNMVPVDKVIAIIGEESEDYKAILAQDNAPAVEDVVQTAEIVEELTAPLNSATTIVETGATVTGRIKASPLAKAMAKEEGIDLATVQGTGDEGRIVKRDVEAAIAAKATTQAVVPVTRAVTVDTSAIQAPTPEGEYEDVMTSQMRKTIARRLGESKFSAPHFYLTVEMCMDKLIAMRKQLKSLSDAKISFNDFVVKATASALKQHPTINSSWLGDRIRYYKYVNIGVAVAVDEGLLVPVVRNTDTKSLSQIGGEIREYAARAKDRKLTPQDMSGNTFTISNLGMFGIEEFTAIINPPDACILAVGGIKKRLVLKDGEVAESSFMKMTLSCDHRVVDGASGARFLQTLKELIEEPMLLMV